VNGQAAANAALVNLLGHDDERAAIRYAALFRKLVKFFEWRCCPDPEELADEAMWRGLSNIAEGAPVSADDPSPYFYGIAKNLLKEQWKAERRAPRLPFEDYAPLVPAPPEAIDTRIYVEQLLAHLDPADRDLVVRYHTEDRRALREELGLTEGTLRVRVHRIKMRLLALSGRLPRHGS
jgi:RNA polymerase sigma-70 factor (ECF subfamily)